MWIPITNRSRGEAMIQKRFCVVMMASGFEMVGDLNPETGKMERPFLVQRQPGPGGTSNLVLIDMLKIGVIAGNSITLNMNQHLWTGDVSEPISKAYKAARGGIVLPGPAAIPPPNGVPMPLRG
jgi:hypothetical protein